MLSRSMKDLLTMLKQHGINDERLLEAMSKVPRELFIDEALSHKAYENTALPIGNGQTISQPYIVAKMTSLLELQATDSVLEIGTGSGYQTAVLAKLVGRQNDALNTLIYIIFRLVMAMVGKVGYQKAPLMLLLLLPVQQKYRNDS